MISSLSDEIINTIETVSGMYFRLLFVAAPAGSGKTAALQDVHERTAAPLIYVNLELSRNMLDLTDKQRVLQVPRLLSTIVETVNEDVVLLDNIEILFDVSLKQDPMRLLQGLSRNKTLVIAWSGSVEGKNLFYATPGHPEYRRYPVRDFLVVKPEDSV